MLFRPARNPSRHAASTTIEPLDGGAPCNGRTRAPARGPTGGTVLGCAKWRSPRPSSCGARRAEGKGSPAAALLLCGALREKRQREEREGDGANGARVTQGASRPGVLSPRDQRQAVGCDPTARTFSGRNEPRREQQIPAQAQVAAWARGGCPARTGHGPFWLHGPRITEPSKRKKKKPCAAGPAPASKLGRKRPRAEWLAAGCLTTEIPFSYSILFSEAFK